MDIISLVMKMMPKLTPEEEALFLKKPTPEGDLVDAAFKEIEALANDSVFSVMLPLLKAQIKIRAIQNPIKTFDFIDKLTDTIMNYMDNATALYGDHFERLPQAP